VPRFDQTPGSIRTAAPALGQHNRELLQEIGLSVDACQDLEKSGVVCGVMPSAS
jgi:crotonobetainyl-CoA:carnitine CoA-transferase CaiB-like acyl-CoA transferase